MSKQLAVSSVLSVLAMASLALLGVPGTAAADGVIAKADLIGSAAPLYSQKLPAIGR